MHRGHGINVQLKTFALRFYPVDVERKIFWSRIPKKKKVNKKTSFYYITERRMNDMNFMFPLKTSNIWFKLLQFFFRVIEYSSRKYEYHKYSVYSFVYPYLAKLAHRLTIFFLNRLKLFLGLEGAWSNFELNMYPTSSKCAVPERSFFFFFCNIKRKERNRRKILLQQYRSMDCPWICA